MSPAKRLQLFQDGEDAFLAMMDKEGDAVTMEQKKKVEEDQL